jgi:hypothetical protein
MAYSLTVDIVDPDGEIKVTHTFWGDTEEEVEEAKAEHLRDCKYFSAAEADDRTIEELEEIDDGERPEAAEDAEDEEE